MQYSWLKYLSLVTMALPLYGYAQGTAAPWYNINPNIKVITPSMSPAQVQATLNAVSNSTVGIEQQFSGPHYAVIFMPGQNNAPVTYTDPSITVGYYEQVLGAGILPTTVQINGNIQTKALPTGSSQDTSLDTFWRGVENLTINPQNATDTETWAVSQASPMRRVKVNGDLVLCIVGANHACDWASGGFLGNSLITGTVVAGSQQQWFTQDTSFNTMKGYVWNIVFQNTNGFVPTGVNTFWPGFPYTYSYQSSQADGKTPPTPAAYRAAPMLVYYHNEWGIFRPTAQTHAPGYAWQTPAAQDFIPMSEITVATPNETAQAINQSLANGKPNLILTPGVYNNLGSAINITHNNAVVMGLGLPVLISQNGQPDMVVAAEGAQAAPIAGVSISGIIFDAGRVQSNNLLQVGLATNAAAIANDPRQHNPNILYDDYARIGGDLSMNTATKVAFTINSAYSIGDNLWLWRADHGSNVGWNANVADNGLVVNGDNVSMLGLAVEHFEKFQTVWNGNNGQIVFYQSEMPYDPPSQVAWNATLWNNTTQVDGYASVEIGPNVTQFGGYGLGIYSFFNQGVFINAESAIAVLENTGVTHPDIQLTHVLTQFLNTQQGMGSINHIVSIIRPNNVVTATGSASNSTTQTAGINAWHG